MVIFFTKYLPLYDSYYVLFYRDKLTKKSVTHLLRSTKFPVTLHVLDSMIIRVYSDREEDCWLTLKRLDKEL